MKLNHLNVTVSNVPETHRFLEKHFALKSYGGREPGEAMSFLSDDNGMVLALTRAARGTEVQYPPGFHVGSSRRARSGSTRSTNVCARTDTR
jgi:hypothetical protein